MQQKIFSFGINLTNKKDDYLKIINEYKDYIYDIYIGPSLDFTYGRGTFTGIHSFDELKRNYTSLQDYERDLLEICDLAKANNIKIDLVYNMPAKTDLDETTDYSKILEETYPFLKQINPEEISCREYMLPKFKVDFPDKYFISVWYENDYKIQEKIVQGYDCVMSNKNFFWNYPSEVSPNIDYRVMTNFICYPKCPGCNIANRKPAQPPCIQIELFTENFTNINQDVAEKFWFYRDYELFKQTFPDLNLKLKFANRFKLGYIFNTMSLYLDYFLDNSYSKYFSFLANNEDGIFFRSKANNYDNTYRNALSIKLKDALKNFDEQEFKTYKLKHWQKLNPNITTY